MQSNCAKGGSQYLRGVLSAGLIVMLLLCLAAPSLSAQTAAAPQARLVVRDNLGLTGILISATCSVVLKLKGWAIRRGNCS